MPETGAVAAGWLLGLQEAAGADERDRAARSRARDVVTELARLQRELLRGGRGRAILARLAELAENVPPAADPLLRDVVAAAVLRARIELARYDG